MKEGSTKFEREVLDRLTKIETKIDDYKEIKKDTSEALQLSKANSEDIKEIKDNTKWLWRTIAGILIAGVIAIVFKI